MEVPGRKHSEIKEASEPGDVFLCEPCLDIGQKLLAAGFCVDCNDFLCRECYKHHHKPRIYRDHVLLDKNAMPKVKPVKTHMEVADNADRCSKHKGEIIKFYCRSDRQLGCGSCMITSHRNCEELISIEEEYKKLNNEITNFDKELDSHSIKKEKNSIKIETNHSQAVKDIKHFLTDTKAFLETLEDKMITEADKLKDSDENKMNFVSATCVNLRNNLHSMTPEFSKLHQTQQNGKLFAMIEEAKDKMKTISKDIDQIVIENKVHTYSFVPEMKIKEMMGNLKALGKLDIKNKTCKENQIDIIHTSEEDTISSNRLSSGNKTASRFKIQNESAFCEFKLSKSTSEVKPYNTEEPTLNTQATTTKAATELNITGKDTDGNSIRVGETRHKKARKRPKTPTYTSSTIFNVKDSTANIKTFSLKQRQAYKESELCIKSFEDYYEPSVKGLALLSDNHLILVDYFYKKVKLLNVKQNKVVTELQLSFKPHDITNINASQVVITMSDAKQIQILSISNQFLSLVQTIKVRGQCRGIVHNDGTLIVTFIRPAKVEVISMSGTVLRLIDKGTTGGPLFVRPEYIAFSLDKTLVYISDNAKNSVTCMTLDGEVKGFYEDKGLIYPCGLTVDKTGSVYVVGGGYGSYIYQISDDCSQGKELLRYENGWKCASSIVYHRKEDKLYVGQSKTIFVYQLKKKL